MHNSRFVTVVVLSISIAASLTHPDFIASRARGGHVYQESTRQIRDHALANNLQQNTTVNIFNQWVDHADHSLGTFQQRYWIDLTNWTEGGPALMYISGEGPASGSPTGYTQIVGYTLGSALFTLEHRYYGESNPGPITNKTMLKTLTVENALADLMNFMQFAQANVLKKSVKWFSVGGSYSGALSAWLKETFPINLVAAYSSSGVVNTRFDYYDFDGHVVSVIPPVCYQAISSVFETFSDMFDNPSTTAQARAIFGTPDYFTKTDMAWMLADGSAMAVQYGMKEYLCNSIVPLSKEEPLQQYAKIIEYLWGATFGSSCYYSTKCLSDPTMSSQWGPSGYCWVYQCCSQVAYWQSGYPGSLRLRDITTDYYMDQCRAAFTPDILPDTYAFNKKFGGAHPDANNVMATQGSDDPWQTAGVLQSLSADYIEVTAQCTDCGHCGDLHSPQASDPASLTKQREAVLTNLRQWIQG